MEPPTVDTPHEGESCYVRNPLTGEFGLHRPWAGGPVATHRPLPQIPRKVLESPCALCAQHDPAPEGLVSSRANPHPLTPHHTLLSWSRHIETPAESDVDEWEELARVSSALMNSVPRPLAYGNLGPRSGASQPHLHAHVVSGPPHSLEDLTNSCGLCSGECPELLRIGDWAASFLPGGAHAEVVLSCSKHADHSGSFGDLARLMHVLWERFARAGWDSGRFLWHRTGHEHLHVLPSVTAEGALETAGGLRVSRYGKEFLQDLLLP